MPWSPISVDALATFMKDGWSWRGHGGSSSGSGGGAVAVSPKEVNFYDYDGTCVHAYTVAEAQKLSELPAAPEHPGLVFQGWNWSLEEVKGLTRAMNIGAMYTTDDGTTRLYITLQEGRTSPMLGVGVNGTVTVDWGDNTTPDTLTGTNVSTTLWTPNHAYTTPGDYVIRLTVDGEMRFKGSTVTNEYGCLLRHASAADTRNFTYFNALRRVEIGKGVTAIDGSSFRHYASIETISIPDNVVSFGGYAFDYCTNLTCVTIPFGTDKISTYTFRYCSTIKVVTIPKSVTLIDGYSFTGCGSLESLCFPESVTNIKNMAFKDCKGLKFVDIPTSITSIGSNAFENCSTLVSAYIPNTITKVYDSAFRNCYGAVLYDFTDAVSVPALSTTNAFEGIPSDCEIRVPAALYDEWIAATNWATYASQIKAY